MSIARCSLSARIVVAVLETIVDIDTTNVSRREHSVGRISSKNNAVFIRRNISFVIYRRFSGLSSTFLDCTFPRNLIVRSFLRTTHAGVSRYLGKSRYSESSGTSFFLSTQTIQYIFYFLILLILSLVVTRRLPASKSFVQFESLRAYG